MASSTRAIQLDFDQNSVKNSVLCVNSQPYYIITSPDKSGHITEIREASSQRLVVKLHHRELLWDLVTFTDHFDGKPIKQSKWITSKTLPDKYPVKFINTGKGSFYWKTDPVHRLALYTGQDVNYQTPIARMIYAGATPSLVLEPETEGFRDQVVASFCLLEQGLRMGEKNAKTADGIVAIDRTVAGYYVDTNR